MGFTGGAGVSQHWIGNARNKDEWRDTQVRIRGPIVRLMEAAFYENFTESAGEVTPEIDDVAADSGEAGASLLVRSSPTGGGNDRNAFIYSRSHPRAARWTSRARNFVTDESTRWSLEDAVKRGVKIRILVEGDITDAMPVKYRSRVHYEQFLQSGIEIHEYQPTMMHTKVLVVDGIWSMFGSANFDNRSLELNDELNVAVTNRELAARFLADLEQDLRVSKRITLEEWRRRGSLMKVRERFWSAFGEVF